MPELSMILWVIGMFIIRIGIPLILLIILGIVIDRWQTRRISNMNLLTSPPHNVDE